ncbi:choice-of-anchor G family protein [Microbacterium sp. NPDC077184]|uniref:choice-of-anchor G family protein n=1 Tax=Microbacterium sp. NPDC077184 TaxID=3154764 RepID=UPI003435BC3C
MNRRMRGGLAALLGAALVIPLSVTATTASWNDREWAYGGPIGTGSLQCDGSTAFDTRSRGTFLAGQLLGVNLDAIAELEEMRLTVNADGTAAPSPGEAIDLGSTPPTFTYANPFDVTALGIVGVDLTGFAVGVPGAALGAANQWAQGAPTGQTAGASGLINDSGAVLVSDDTPSDDLPAPGTIDITALLPTIPGLSTARLEVGAVAASSQLDGCAALREQIWGIAPAEPAVQRDYGIAGLDVVVDAPAVGALTGAVNTTVTGLNASVADLVGPGGLIAQTLESTLLQTVTGLVGVDLTGTVTITGLDLGATVAPFLGLTLDGNGFTIDLANGRILVDIERLSGPLNNAGPNTQLVLNAGVVNDIVAEAGILLDEWVDDVVAALDTAIRAAQLTISLSSTVSRTVLGVPVEFASVTVTLSSTIGQVLSGETTVSVSASLLGGIIPTPLLNALLSGILGSAGALTTALVGLLTTELIDPITTLGATLSTLSAPVVNALAGLVNALPSVVSLMVNVQPDQAGAPPGSTYIEPGPRSTAEYAVTALRLGLADFDTPADVAHVRFATGSAGPVTLP